MTFRFVPSEHAEQTDHGGKSQYPVISVCGMGSRSFTLSFAMTTRALLPGPGHANRIERGVGSPWLVQG